MGTREDNKIILVKRKTRLEDLVARYNTVLQAKFYIEHMGADFGDYIREDTQYGNALSQVKQALEQFGLVQVVDREFIPNFLFGSNDIVVALGQDGLVANTMKYLADQLLIGVNPDPARWDGVLLPFKVTDMRHILQDVLKGVRPVKEVTMAKAMLNDGQILHAVNDLFIGQRTHLSARYQLSLADKTEQQSSSGIIVSTGLGATGWLRSILAGAAGIASSVSETKIVSNLKKPAWNADYLYFSVREPFPSKTTGANLAFGKITKSSPLKILSKMPEGGVIFSDGVEQDYLQFNSGITATVTLSEKVGRLVV